MKRVSSIAFNAVYVRFMKKTTPKECLTTKVSMMKNWDNVNFPSSNIDIDTFEENNGGKIAVNVYFLDPEEGKQSILLYRQSKVSKATHQVSLPKLEDGDDYHYVFIKDYDKIIGSQTNKTKAKKHHCFHCQHGLFTKRTSWWTRWKGMYGSWRTTDTNA